MKTSVCLCCVLVGRHLVTLLLWSAGVVEWCGVECCAGVLSSAQPSYSAVISLQASWAGAGWERERAARSARPGQYRSEGARAGQGWPGLRTRLLSHNCVELDRSQSLHCELLRGLARHHRKSYSRRGQIWDC